VVLHRPVCLGIEVLVRQEGVHRRRYLDAVAITGRTLSNVRDVRASWNVMCRTV
jgi:hypothetical protein